MFSLKRTPSMCRGYLHNSTSSTVNFDWDFYLNSSNHLKIKENAERRGIKNIALLLQKINEIIKDNSIADKLKNFEIDSKLKNDILQLPNKTHEKVLDNITNEPVVLEKIGSKPEFNYHPATFDSLAKRLNLCRTLFLSHITGSRSYFLKNDLARLERALVKFTLQKLLKNGFTLISVPDILNKSILQACGMNTEGEHSQVFHIDEKWGKDLCLSGTAEIALAAFLAQKTFKFEDLPLKLCSVSRCYRAEAKRASTEKGIFRVHTFTKVEMFGITSSEKDDEESENLMKEFVSIQKSLFQELGLHFQVLEMPAHDLGLPAYHKIDIETWLPGRKFYGEISSASNCTDFQCRRLNIRYNSPQALQEKFCHSVNGTACAVPRMLIAIFENFQNLNGSINIPPPLQSYLNKNVINEKFPEILKCLKTTG